jgi:hypothetical protein
MTGEEVETLPADPEQPARGGSLARDLVNVFWRPGALFAELPRTNRVAGALILLLILHALYGWAVISTGVPDHEIDRRTQEEISRLRQHPPSKEEAEKFNTALEAIEKGAVFQKQLKRVQMVAGQPIGLLIGLSLTSGLIFLVTALRGGKPNFPVLLGVTTFAAYVEVPRLLISLLLIAQLQVMRVETSAAAFVSGQADVGLGAFLLLRRLDPFELWYYLLLGLGVYQTGQLRRRAAIVTICVLALLGAFAGSLRDVQELAEITAVSIGSS